MADYNLAGSEPLSLIANAAVNANRFIRQGAIRGQCQQSSVNTDITLGVSLIGGALNESIPFQSYGKAKVTAGAAVVLGAQVQSDATGRAVTVTTGGVSLGQCAEAAGAAGDIIEVFLTPLPNLNGPVNP